VILVASHTKRKKNKKTKKIKIKVGVLKTCSCGHYINFQMPALHAGKLWAIMPPLQLH
jgi:hypothetical protein